MRPLMEKQNRREAIRQYKDQKPEPGIFAVRCAATGEAWVGMSRNLAQQQNGIWFSLRMGGHPNRAVQAAWNAHGAESFGFEVLEVVDDEGLSRLGLESRLKDRSGHWREALAAGKLVG
jgi:hypothetical protein